MSGVPARDPARRWERWVPLLLLAGTAAFYLVRLGAAGLYDSNEGMYAEIPREMILLGDWLTPHFNFIRYFEKPPLLYWLTALAYQVLGVSEFSARLVTALAAVAGVGVIYGIGRNLWGWRVGLASGLIMATCCSPRSWPRPSGECCGAFWRRRLARAPCSGPTPPWGWRLLPRD